MSVDAARLAKIGEGAAQMGVRLGPDQLKQLGRHVDLMLKWNRSVNLTAITDPDEVAEKHVLDSLAIVPVLPAGSLLDAGTGAGFPGIPAAIARPDLEVVLVDSVQKKVAFLKSEHLPRAEPLPKVGATPPRSEQLPKVGATTQGRSNYPRSEQLPKVGATTQGRSNYPRLRVARWSNPPTSAR